MVSPAKFEHFESRSGLPAELMASAATSVWLPKSFYGYSDWLLSPANVTGSAFY